MHEAGLDVAIFESHTQSGGSDPFENEYSVARCSWYGVSGMPESFIDGIISELGGVACPNPGGMFGTFETHYNTRKAINSPFTIELFGENTGDLTYDATIIVTMVETINVDNCAIHLVITETDIEYSWQGCMDYCNFVNRLMVPDHMGTPIELTGNQQTLELSFTIDEDWVEDNIEVLAFVQDMGTKEVHQATGTMLDALAPPVLHADFQASETVICAGAQIDYTDLSQGQIVSWSWSFPGGSPATSNQQNPSIWYTEGGTFDATLTVSDGTEQDQMTKTNYINVSSETPSTPGAPEGETQLCKSPENQEYTTSGSTEAMEYIWEVDPITAGYIMNNGEQTVTINWLNAFTGDASLHVKAINGCGESGWSENLAITVSPRPDVFSIDGGGTFCEGSGGVEITLDNSVVGVDYEVYADDKPTDNILAGTGGPLTFTAVADTGICTVVGTDMVTTCTNVMDNEVEVIMIYTPVAYNITGGGEYCEGTSGVAVGLDGSEIDVDYELYKDDQPTGTMVTGTGDAISFGEQTEGVYTAIAYKSELMCENMMEGNVDVTMIPLPEVPTTPDGPAYVDLLFTQTTEYTTVPGAYTTSCEWMLEPAAAGTINIIDLETCEVTWDLSFQGAVTLKVRDVNDCGESDWSDGFEITIFNSVGLDENIKDLGLKVSPNPSTGQFHLFLTTNQEELVTIRVLNSLNAVVYEAQDIPVNGKYTQNIDLSDVTNGIYFLYVEAKNTMVSKKLVKQ